METQIEPTTPILMCSVPGYDASSRVDDLAAELGKQVILYIFESEIFQGYKGIRQLPIN